MKHCFIFICLVTFLSCQKEYTVPNTEITTINLEPTTTLNSVISNLDRFEENIITFSDDLIIEAYVVSSDKGGNFFNELIIQDKVENPTAGIALQINERSLFERFPFGSKIYIQLKGLSIGYQNGVIELGRLNEIEIDTLTEFLIDEHIFRTNEIHTITPLFINLETVTEKTQNLYVSVDHMQFPKELLEPTPKTLAAENTDNFDGIRALFNCESELQLMLSTSVFSDFKTMTLPSSTGSVTGVLTRDFDNLHYVLKMNSANDLNFFNETRCDVEYYDCNNNNFTGMFVLFNEDFEEITNENLLEPLGWLNVNITGDEKRWVDKKITNVDNRVITLSAFNSNLQPLHVWLVTPEVNTDTALNTYLQFRVRTLFNNGDALKVWITNNFSEHIETTEWELLNIDFPNISSNYITVKKDISCLSGNIRIGFEYKGFDSIITSTYDIDNIFIYAEEAP